MEGDSFPNANPLGSETTDYIPFAARAGGVVSESICRVFDNLFRLSFGTSSFQDKTKFN